MNGIDMNLSDKSCVVEAAPDELFAERKKQAKQLPEDVLATFENAIACTNRSEDARSTLSKFNELLADGIQKPTLQLGFGYDWFKTKPELYNICWWITEWPFGVYFIYDSDRVLRYVGSSWETMGKRLWSLRHEDWRHSCEIVLFPRDLGHLALAFECYAIARLSETKSSHVELTNQDFINLRFPFATPSKD